MNFLELAKSRFAVRQYTGQVVTDDELNYILECGRVAPSAVNFQPWHFYVVMGEEKRALLQQCYNRDWFKEAPVYIVCSVHRDQAWTRQSDGKPHGDIDIAIAVEHMCLAAAELGMGTCWVCNFDAAMCADVMDMATDEYPAVIIALGHTEAVAPEKNRKPLEEIVTRL